MPTPTPTPTKPDNATDWLALHQQLVLSFLEDGESVREPAWQQAPWLVLWRVTGTKTRWLSIGTFPRSRELAIARGRLFTPGLGDEEAERAGRLPTLQDVLVSEQESAREVLRAMVAAREARLAARGARDGLADEAALLRRWAEDDGLWPGAG
jgi:hypothetical protein